MARLVLTIITLFSFAVANSTNAESDILHKENTDTVNVCENTDNNRTVIADKHEVPEEKESSSSNILLYIILIPTGLIIVVMAYNRTKKKIITYDMVIQHIESLQYGEGTQVHIMRLGKLPAEVQKSVLSRTSIFKFKYLYGFSFNDSVVATLANENGDILNTTLFAGHAMDEKLSAFLSSNKMITINIRQ